MKKKQRVISKSFYTGDTRVKDLKKKKAKIKKRKWFRENNV